MIFCSLCNNFGKPWLEPWFATAASNCLLLFVCLFVGWLVGWLVGLLSLHTNYSLQLSSVLTCDEASRVFTLLVSPLSAAWMSSKSLACGACAYARLAAPVRSSSDSEKLLRPLLSVSELADVIESQSLALLADVGRVVSPSVVVIRPERSVRQAELSSENDILANWKSTQAIDARYRCVHALLVVLVTPLAMCSRSTYQLSQTNGVSSSSVVIQHANCNKPTSKWVGLAVSKPRRRRVLFPERFGW